MRYPFASRLLLAVGVMLVVAPGCGRKPVPPQRFEERAPAPNLPAPEGETASTSRGEVAGVRFLERMTGGARPDERVPMIVALHPMGGDPADFLPLLQRYRRRARLVVPYGHPSGGMYVWFDYVSDDVPRAVVSRETDRVAAALRALVVARPTVGKPFVTGFSQGGTLTFALAVTHPDALAAAFPIGGLLPLALYPSASLSSEPRPAKLPPITAFHGSADLAVPTQGARASIAELKAAGYSAELHEYEGVEHDISPQEERDVLERIGRAAEEMAHTP